MEYVPKDGVGDSQGWSITPRRDWVSREWGGGKGLQGCPCTTFLGWGNLWIDMQLFCRYVCAQPDMHKCTHTFMYECM